jgi:hypothetical protein
MMGLIADVFGVAYHALGDDSMARVPLSTWTSLFLYFAVNFILTP